MAIDFICPRGCEAGYIVNETGPHECVECGSPMIDPDQTVLWRYEE